MKIKAAMILFCCLMIGVTGCSHSQITTQKITEETAETSADTFSEVSDGMTADTSSEVSDGMTADTSSEVSGGISADTSVETVTETPEDTSAGESSGESTGDGLIDLTQMSSTMVYSQVFCMLMAPEDYEGQRVKMKGALNVFHIDQTGEDCLAVIIADAAGCCRQGLQFTWEGEHSYPEDYPEIGTEITVEGEFQDYMKDGHRYCGIFADSVSWK